MSISGNRVKVRFVPGESVNIRIGLSMGTIDHFDFSEDFDNEVAEAKGKAINPIVNGDTVRFKPDTGSYSTSTLTVIFSASTSSYLNAGFNSTEINGLSPSFVNSSYIYQIYDSTNSVNQNLVATGFINGYQILTNALSVHTIGLNKECFNVYLTQDYIDSITATTFTLYFKYLFYRAKDGNLLVFTQNTGSLTDESLLYFPLIFTKSTRTYMMPSSQSLLILQSPEYSNIINQSISSINMEKPVFPAGDTFKSDGTYSQTN